MSEQKIIDGVHQIDGGAPAFPVSIPSCGDNGWHGMSLRDWFAGQAIMAIASRWQGTIGDIDDEACGCTARIAYDLADAMLEARRL